MTRNFTLLAVIFLIGLLPLQSTAQESYTGDFPIFDGIWDTEMGIVAMWQANDAVYAVYKSNANLGGHIDENGVLQFGYEDSPDDLGSGWFKIVGDGHELEGYYNSSLEPAVHGTWNGTWLGPNEFDVNDRDALNYQAGDTGSTYSPEQAVETPAAPEVEVEVPVEEPQGFTGDAEIAWTGGWDTTRGELEINIEDGVVTGTFGDNCTLEGTITGSTLTGTWSITDEDGNVTTGDLLFSLSEDGMSFRGTYNSTTEPDLWLAWHGSKLSEELPLAE
jgi:hypothetical protein